MKQLVAICAQYDSGKTKGSTYKAFKSVYKLKPLSLMMINEINDWRSGNTMVMKHQRVEGLKLFFKNPDIMEAKISIYLPILGDIADFISDAQICEEQYLKIIGECMTWDELAKAISCIEGIGDKIEAIAFISESRLLLNVCESEDEFLGYDKPFATIKLPWKGNGKDLENQVLSSLQTKPVKKEGLLPMKTEDLSNPKTHSKVLLFLMKNSSRLIWKLAVVASICGLFLGAVVADTDNKYFAGIFLSVLFFIGGLLIGWQITYPHLGWKRLALVLSILAPAFLLIKWDIDDSFPDTTIDTLLFLLFVAVLTPALVLFGRETFYWVKRGFNDQK